MALSTNDPYLLHAHLERGFDCATCARYLKFTSRWPDWMDDWFIELAQQAKAEGWYILQPDPDDDTDPGDTTWCAECAKRLGFIPGGDPKNDNAA